MARNPCALFVLILGKFDHDVVNAKIPVLLSWRLCVDLNHIDILAPGWEVPRDIEREGRLMSCP